MKIIIPMNELNELPESIRKEINSDFFPKFLFGCRITNVSNRTVDDEIEHDYSKVLTVSRLLTKKEIEEDQVN